MEVKTEQGYKPIESIKVGDKVYAKNELTGQMTYQRVKAHYNNPYDFTVYVEVIDEQGKHQTLVSNKIHPFFTQVNQGELVPSSEGHHYNGEIQNAQWVDAQNLKAGYKLLSEHNQWQTVKSVSIKAEKLSAYNLTVENDHTYFIKGSNSYSDGVWVHNDCWHALPDGAKRVKDIDGYHAYKFKNQDGKEITVIKKDLNRFETVNHNAGTDPHFNRLSQRIDEQTGRYLSTDKPVDQFYNRSYLRSDTMKKIFEQYEVLPNGNYRDKITRAIVKGPIDIGHAYGWEHRRLSLAAKELNWSQKQFNNYVNARPNKFRLENMSENRSHRNEMPGKDKMDFSKFNDLDLEEKIVESNFNNDLQLLRKIFLENKLADIKKITSLDKWNYLHRILCYSEPKVELIQFYIDNGVDVNAQDIYGMTPLHYALRSKNAEAAIALLKAGANPNLPNQDGLIPLSMIGYIPERLDVLELMLQKGANVHYLVNEDETILESYKPTENEPQLKPIYELMKKYS